MKNNLLLILFILFSYSSFSQRTVNQSPIGIQTEGIKSVSNVAVSMPFFEDFESCVEPLIPDYWYKIVVSSDTYANVRSYNTQGVDNSKCVKLVNVNDLEANLLLITPALEGGAANKYLHFYSWSYGSELSVGTITDPTDISTYTELLVLNIPNINDMEEYEVYFSDYTGTDEYIAFKGVYSNTYGDIALDNITIDDLLPCTDPSDVNANEITQTSALMEWTENGEATTWRIEYGDMGFSPSGVAMTTTEENPCLLEGLDAGTYYDFYVQADCGGGSVSAWIGPYYFSTLCETSTSIPYIQGFEEVILPFMPPCNLVENTNNDDLNWISSDVNAYNGNQHAMIEYSDTEEMDDWFFSPGIELVGGETYNVNFFYTSSSDTYYENLEVKFGTEPNAASMTSEVIFEDLMFALNNIYQPANASFTPNEDGIYYVGWHGFSEAANGNILIDDINVEMNEASSALEAPTNLTGPTEVQNNEDIVLSWEAVSTPSANFFEGFEGDFLPEGWSKFNMDGGSGWMQVEVGEAVPGWTAGTITACPSGGFFQAYATWLTGGSPGNDQWLVTPQIIYSEGDTLGFWMGIYMNTFSEHLEVLVSTTVPDDPAAFDIVVDIIDIPEGTPIGWTYYFYDLTNLVPDGTPIYIAFREYVLNNSNEGNATSLDNISLRKAGSKSSSKQFLGYHIYHKLNSGDFEKIGFTSETSFTHNTPDVGIHTYYVTSQYTEGESEPSNEHVVDVVLGVSEELSMSTIVYPIPASDHVYIETENMMQSICIYSQTGQKISEMPVNNRKHQINTSDLASGIYSILIDTNEGRIQKKFIVK